MITIDFETKPIVFGSKIPPEPVGLAIRYLDGSCYYYAWGHPTENNCTKETARDVLSAIWDQPLIGHNIFGFDLGVAEHWFELPPRDPLLTEDTLFLAYLHDPHTPSLKLKDLAANWLGIPPDSQETMNHWILANVPGVRTLKQCGAHICQAPGGMVGEYAMDDVRMTHALYEYCKDKLAEMSRPYAREQKLGPILAKLQRGGIRVDTGRLLDDYTSAMEKLHNLDKDIRGQLCAPNLNIGSDRDLVTALQGAGFRNFLLTPTGNASANKQSLEQALSDAPQLRAMLKTRATYSTLTSTFMGPWLQLCKMNDGTINPSYSSTRNPDGYGTRTGRLSSSNPNGQNIVGDQGLDFFGDPFPQMRSYCLPDPGQVWISIDLKSQEPRIAAHYENGKLMQAFINNPDLDPYQFVTDIIGGDVTRKESKVVFLGLLYSMGIAVLAQSLGCGADRATALRHAIRASLPDINTLNLDCMNRFYKGVPIMTLGGRFVNCEPPANGRTWEYKALNLLVQGSAADQTKEMVIFLDERLPEGARLLGTVHDEVNISAPADEVDNIYVLGLAAANALKCDVPMRITMGVGANWAEAAK